MMCLNYDCTCVKESFTLLLYQMNLVALGHENLLVSSIDGEILDCNEFGTANAT